MTAYAPAALDEIDRRILIEVQADGRIRVADLARRLSLSRPAVTERLRRLEESDVIRGYHADIDPAAVGYALSVIVRVRPAVRQLDKLRELAVSSPEVVECHRITGEDCYFFKVRLRTMDELEPLLRQVHPVLAHQGLHHSLDAGAPRGLPLAIGLRAANRTQPAGEKSSPRTEEGGAEEPRAELRSRRRSAGCGHRSRDDRQAHRVA